MAVPVWNGVSFGPTGQKIREIINLLVGNDSGYYITSAYRPNDTGSHHGGLSYNGSPTAAVDVGFGYGTSAGTARARKLAAKLYEMSGDIVELIHASNPSGFYVKNSKKVGPYAAADHWDHIHLAMSSSQADKVLKRLKGSSGGSSGSGPSIDNKASPIFGCDLYDFTVDAGFSTSNAKSIVTSGGLSFVNAKIAEVDSSGNVWVHTKALKMLNAAKDAGVPFPMGFVVPRSGVSAKRLMDEAIKALNTHCSWWKSHPTFSFQVDTEKWEYDSVSLDKGIEVAKYIRDTLKLRVAAVYAPDWGYEGSRGPISKVKSAGFNWWSSEYVGSGASRNYRQMYSGAGGKNAPGWRVVDGVRPTLNQYCSDGKVPGYGGNLVMTAFEGTAQGFANAIGANFTSKEDDVPYRDWPKADREALADDVATAVAKRKNPTSEVALGTMVRKTWSRTKRLPGMDAELDSIKTSLQELTDGNAAAITDEQVAQLADRVADELVGQVGAPSTEQLVGALRVVLREGVDYEVPESA